MASLTSTLDLPRPGKTALPYAALAICALALDADPRLPWVAGVAGALLFPTAGTVRPARARHALTAVDMGRPSLHRGPLAAATPLQRLRRPLDADRPARGDAAAEDARAPDLRLGPAVVGRLRNRVGARRAARRLGGVRATGLPDLDRDRCAPRGRGRLVHADGARLRDERRRLHRRARQPRHAAEPRRRLRAPDGLRAHGRGLDLGGKPPEPLVCAFSLPAPSRSLT